MCVLTCVLVSVHVCARLCMEFQHVFLPVVTDAGLRCCPRGWAFEVLCSWDLAGRAPAPQQPPPLPRPHSEEEAPPKLIL